MMHVRFFSPLFTWVSCTFFIILLAWYCFLFWNDTMILFLANNKIIYYSWTVKTLEKKPLPDFLFYFFNNNNKPEYYYISIAINEEKRHVWSFTAIRRWHSVPTFWWLSSDFTCSPCNLSYVLSAKALIPHSKNSGRLLSLEIKPSRRKMSKPLLRASNQAPSFFFSFRSSGHGGSSTASRTQSVRRHRRDSTCGRICCQMEEAQGVVTAAKSTVAVKAIVTVNLTIGGIFAHLGLNCRLDDVADLLGKSLYLELISSELDPSKFLSISEGIFIKNMRPCQTVLRGLRTCMLVLANN